jgi:hypothetical protein
MACCPHVSGSARRASKGAPSTLVLNWLASSGTSHVSTPPRLMTAPGGGAKGGGAKRKVKES